MESTELVTQKLNITAILKQPEQRVEETDDDYRLRWALSLQNNITMGSHLVAASLWQLHRNGLYVCLGYKSIKSFMASDSFPFSPGYGGKMIMAIDRYQAELGPAKVIGMLEELGVKRMYEASNENFDIREIDDEVEFIHSDTGTVVTASQLKELGANDTADTLRRLRKQNMDQKDEIELLNREKIELEAQIKVSVADGQSALDLRKALQAKDALIAELKKQQYTDATARNEIEKSVKLVRKGLGTLDELLSDSFSNQVQNELEQEISSLYGIFKRTLNKINVAS